MTADKSEPSVAKFEAFDNDGDNNDTRAPGHETEYLVPAAPEQLSLVTSPVTSPGSVRYFILQRILQSHCYNSIHIKSDDVHKLRILQMHEKAVHKTALKA